MSAQCYKTSYMSTSLPTMYIISLSNYTKSPRISVQRYRRGQSLHEHQATEIFDFRQVCPIPCEHRSGCQRGRCVRSTRLVRLPVNRVGAFFERRGKALECGVEHGAHQHRQHPALEFVGNVKSDLAGGVRFGLERPAVLE